MKRLVILAPDETPNAMCPIHNVFALETTPDSGVYQCWGNVGGHQFTWQPA